MIDKCDTRLLIGEPADLPLIFKFEQAYIQCREPNNMIAWQSALHRHLEQWVRCLPRTVVATVGDEKVGYTFWEREGSTATLASIHVKPAFRRQGIGALLLTRFEDDAAQTGCNLAKLHVLEANPARHLYEAGGYGTAGREGCYAILTKELAGTRPRL